MRLASREICDDETWANTVRNRSQCSVQERLSMLSDAEDDDDSPAARGARRRKLIFAERDLVRVFQVERDHAVDDIWDIW